MMCPQERKANKRRRSASPIPSQLASPPTQPSPSLFPELLESAKRFAVASPKPNKLTSESPHRPSPGKTASPTIKQLFSRQAASQSPANAKPKPSSAMGQSIPPKSVPGSQAAADGHGSFAPSRVQTQRAASAAATAKATTRAVTPDRQDDTDLVKHAAGLLSQAIKSSPASQAAHRRSAQRATATAEDNDIAARHQRSSPISPDAGSAVEDADSAGKQELDVSSPARKQEGGASASRAGAVHRQRPLGSQASRRPVKRQNQQPKRQPLAQEAEVIDLMESD